MAEKSDLEVIDFMNKVMKGVKPDKVILDEVDTTCGKYPAFSSIEQLEADMREKGINMRYAYNRSICLRRTLFIINDDFYQVIMLSKSKESNVRSFYSIVVVKDGKPIDRADSPFRDLKPAAVCRYLTGLYCIDMNLYRRFNPASNPGLVEYSSDEDLKEVPRFYTSGDKDNAKTVESFQRILNDKSVIAFYENNEFKYAKIQVTFTEFNENTRKYDYTTRIVNVWLEDGENGVKVLTSDIDLYGKGVCETIRYSELASLLLKLQQTTLDITEVGEEERAPKSIAVKGFGK